MKSFACNIDKMAIDYLYISSAHKKSVISLAANVQQIIDSNLDNPNEQYKKIFTLLLNEFTSQIAIHTGHKFLSKPLNPVEVARLVREKQSSHHYIRLLAIVIMSEVINHKIKIKDTEFDIIQKCLRSPDTGRICLPDNTIYDNRIKSIMSETEKEDYRRFYTRQAQTLPGSEKADQNSYRAWIAEKNWVDSLTI
jgi:hypothetical protein